MAETIWEKDTEHTVASTAHMTTTFLVLAVFALIQLAVGFSDLGLGHYKVVANLLITVVQSAILLTFFMDLRQADNLTLIVAGSALFWVGLLFLFTLTDYITRHLAAY